MTENNNYKCLECGSNLKDNAIICGVCGVVVKNYMGAYENIIFDYDNIISDFLNIHDKEKKKGEKKRN